MQAADAKGSKSRAMKMKVQDDPLTFNFDRPENAPPTGSALNSREVRAVYRHRRQERSELALGSAYTEDHEDRLECPAPR